VINIVKVENVDNKNKKFVITKDGDVIEKKITFNTITSQEYIPKLPDLTHKQILKEMLTPDKTELSMIIYASVLLYYIRNLLEIKLINPNILTILGVLLLMFYTGRWGYPGISHFIARQKLISERIRKGEPYIIDFKIFGFIFSILLIIIGTWLGKL